MRAATTRGQHSTPSSDWGGSDSSSCLARPRRGPLLLRAKRPIKGLQLAGNRTLVVTSASEAFPYVAEMFLQTANVLNGGHAKLATNRSLAVAGSLAGTVAACGQAKAELHCLHQGKDGPMLRCWVGRLRYLLCPSSALGWDRLRLDERCGQQLRELAPWRWLAGCSSCSPEEGACAQPVPGTLGSHSCPPQNPGVKKRVVPWGAGASASWTKTSSCSRLIGSVVMTGQLDCSTLSAGLCGSVSARVLASTKLFQDVARPTFRRPLVTRMARTRSPVDVVASESCLSLMCFRPLAR
eukprot:scaffold536_cov409-Prasinococcus_capsulatus_cf.AAC.10